jgi:hypothetical protein
LSDHCDKVKGLAIGWLAECGLPRAEIAGFNTELYLTNIKHQHEWELGKREIVWKHETKG